MKVKVTRNGPIRWQISTCMKVIPENFSPAVTIFEIRISKFLTLQISSRSWCTALAVASFDGKCPACYLTAIVMLALSLTVLERRRHRRRHHHHHNHPHLKNHHHHNHHHHHHHYHQSPPSSSIIIIIIVVVIVSLSFLLLSSSLSKN